jgi:hypothetical protein
MYPIGRRFLDQTYALFFCAITVYCVSTCIGYTPVDKRATCLNIHDPHIAEGLEQSPVDYLQLNLCFAAKSSSLLRSSRKFMVRFSESALSVS